ncbi:MAG TPA: efflux RND transporter periplasmic adaptor subunit [Candidatus Obscuribacterales bacterium]
MVLGKIDVESETGAHKKRPRVPASLIMLFAIFAIAAASVVAWNHFNTGHDRAEIARNMVEVTRGEVDLLIEATGVIRPVNQVKISPKVTGLLKRLLVKQGQFVRRGEIIAYMDDSNLIGQVEAARSAVRLQEANYQKALHGNRPQEIANSEAQIRKHEQLVRFAEQAILRANERVKSCQAELLRDQTNASRLTQLAKEGAISDQERLNATTQAEVALVALRQAKQELQQAETNLAQAKADLESARQQASLIKAGFRKEDIEAAKYALDQARGTLQYLESQLADTKIKAPFDGIVTQKYTDEGAIVTPTTSAATNSATSSSIISLAGALELVAQVSEDDIEHIQMGQKVEIVPNAYPDRKFKGHVTLIAPEAVVTQNVTTFEVHAALDDDESHSLMSGMNVNAVFHSGLLKDVLLVPTACIISQHGKSGVLVPDKSGAPTFKAIRTGATSGTKTVVVDGLKAGDKVFLGLTKAQLEQQGYADSSQLKVPGFSSGKNRPPMPRVQHSMR